jgi:hypothetical protein
MNSYVLSGYLVTFLAIGGHVISLIVRQRRSRVHRARIAAQSTNSSTFS